MKITLPKELKGFNYDPVIPVHFNTFDIDLFPQGLYFKVVSRGQA